MSASSLAGQLTRRQALATGAANFNFTANELTLLNAQVDAIEIQGARLSGPLQDITGVEAPMPG